MGVRGESGYHNQHLNEFDCLEYSKDEEGGVGVKKKMLLGGRSKGYLLIMIILLNKDEWIVWFVFQPPMLIVWRCFKFARIHSKRL